MSVRVFQVDAFTERPFQGNPAAVCILERPAEAAWMQAVAAEMNLSETAFVVPDEESFDLRWFTPVTEVDLCGHATLAAAHVLWETGRRETWPIRFETRSGQLTAARAGAGIRLDFPSDPPRAGDLPEGVADALGAAPVSIARGKDYVLVELASEAEVRSVEPDFARLASLVPSGLCITALAEAPDFDFVSRFFAPAFGIDEDPVTGSAHCLLGPLWADRLGKTELVGFQASPRGGVVRVRMLGERVLLEGMAVTITRGELLPAP